MIVLAWFTLIGIIILIGFALVGATFVHWYKEKKIARKAAAAAQVSASLE
ncbi:hypothetical protein ACLWBD_10540 [Bdellovibrio sp. HCB117]|nr:hypothetical protein [Bdellovibrio bacteriovorus]